MNHNSTTWLQYAMQPLFIAFNQNQGKWHSIRMTCRSKQKVNIRMNAIEHACMQRNCVRLACASIWCHYCLNLLYSYTLDGFASSSWLVLFFSQWVLEGNLHYLHCNVLLPSNFIIIQLYNYNFLFLSIFFIHSSSVWDGICVLSDLHRHRTRSTFYEMK